MIIICLVLLVLICLGTVLYSCDFDFLGPCISIICLAILLIVAMLWPLNYYTEKENIQRYHAIKSTMENSRLTENTQFERVQLTQQILEVNTWIESCKYWNSTIFDRAIPDEIENLEYLK